MNVGVSIKKMTHQLAAGRQHLNNGHKAESQVFRCPCLTRTLLASRFFGNFFTFF